MKEPPTKESFHLKTLFPASPHEIFELWLSSEGHSAMTGGEARCSAVEGEHFSAWSDYITGSNETLTPYERIVQRWRTTEFGEEDEDSRVEILLSNHPEGTEFHLIHSNIPAGQIQYQRGWQEHYFEPMHSYFTKNH